MAQAELQLSLLGGLTITYRNTAVSQFASRKVEGLLVYLACSPRPHPRETLAALLWPDNDQNRALANLSVALTSLRKQLPTAVLAERHTVAFNTEQDYMLDTAAFQRAASQARDEQKRSGKLGHAGAAQLAAAVTLYRGDFLAGFNIRNAPEFEAWVLLEQERLRQQFLAALADLVTFHRQRGRLDAAIAYAQQLLAVDPLQEDIHRQLMTLFAQNNQRPAALAQYEQYRRILNEELSVKPAEETVLLYKQIAEGQLSDLSPSSEGENSTALPRADTAPHNLLAAGTAFIGRSEELARITTWLQGPNSRLLTIVGPGGMGKSRLAHEAARAQIGQFADGVWLVSLVKCASRNEMVTAVAEAIGLIFSGQTEPDKQLLSHLQGREMLLVLDNLEHLITPDLLALITDIGQQAPDVRLIVTSRERLRLQAEAVLDLRGLPFPRVASLSTVVDDEGRDDHLPPAEYSAVQLFVDRAQRVQSSFQLDGQEMAVMQLCRLVGGLPLALELAASWARVLAVADIVAEIECGLDSLTTTLLDVPERHRSLQAVVDSSWQLLAAEEQQLFRRVSVFRGGFTRAAAEQVAGASLPHLMALVDRSFLRLDGDRRFRRHPLLLQFAQEQLAAEGEEQSRTEAAHARYFATWLQALEPDLQGKDALQTLAAIEADLENCRTAWRWALSTANWERLLQLVGGLGRFFEYRSRYLEGTALFSDGLQVLEQAAAVPSALIAGMQTYLGTFLYHNGRRAEAEAVLREACRLAQQHDLVQTRILALSYLGEVMGEWGEREAAPSWN